MRKFKDKKSITAWLDKYGITHYTLIEDDMCGFVVNIGGEVDLGYKKLTNISIQFGKVSGSFYCSNNRLTSLKGCPISVGGGFYCYSNRITSLEGGPTSVGENFDCHRNQLTSLKGCPTSVGGSFSCIYNQLTSLYCCPNCVNGKFYCDNNEVLGQYQPITDFKIIKEKILSDNEKKVLSTSLNGLLLKSSVFKI